MESRHVSTVIAAEPDAVYAFAAEPENLPRWASGLAEAEVAREGDLLVVESPMGRVTVRFAPPNEYGVLDHDVTLPSGAVVTNPLRVVAHPHGSEVVFTVRRLDLAAEEFDRDCATVARDLDRLRELVEGGS
ncbi:SRPBCC family protein [Nocardioides rotundus]|uniref:SRPBCC family protein n=1 Tax=Nocardioides rotundus TaxID=1774216 RepID=UPI001CBE4B07|nr:SRPBCC family protein [Nocardioides rotundus]UAL29749.1 SRPBCC family protein [Nocardioides rotundus]